MYDFIWMQSYSKSSPARVWEGASVAARHGNFELFEKVAAETSRDVYSWNYLGDMLSGGHVSAARRFWAQREAQVNLGVALFGRVTSIVEIFSASVAVVQEFMYFETSLIRSHLDAKTMDKQ